MLTFLLEDVLRISAGDFTQGEIAGACFRLLPARSVTSPTCLRGRG